jgi:hypothetical protein
MSQSVGTEEVEKLKCREADTQIVTEKMMDVLFVDAVPACYKVRRT